MICSQRRMGMCKYVCVRLAAHAPLLRAAVGGSAWRCPWVYAGCMPCMWVWGGLEQYRLPLEFEAAWQVNRTVGWKTLQV